MARKGQQVDVVSASYSAMDLGELVAAHLSSKAFCTIDAGIDSSMLSKALQESMELGGQGRLRRPPTEIVEGLLGELGSAEVAELELGEDGAAPLSDGEGLHTLDKAMSRIAACSSPFFPGLGFESTQRTPALVHLSKTPDSEPGMLTEAEASEWLFQFMKGVVMCVVPIGPDSSSVTIEPYEDETEPFQIELKLGTILVLRTDTLSISHESTGNCFLLSCFFLDDRQLDDKRSTEVPLTPAIEKLTLWATSRLDELKTREVDGKDVNVPKMWLKTMNQQSFKGQHMAVRGAAIRSPVTWDPDMFFMANNWGVDYMLEVPLIRWDHSKSYNPHPDSWRWYMTNCKHISYMDGPELFDNKMFSITPAESKVMDPHQRVILECGYEALFCAGLKKGKIMNSLGGMYCGYATGASDFSNVDRSTDSGAEGSFGATGGSAAITANRFSFCLGMKGPSLSIDAEDASGLTSVHLGAEGLQRKGRLKVNDFSLCGGIRLNLAMFYWPQKQAAGLLSASGRTKTFDNLMDGFGQGDSCCNVCLKEMFEIVDNKFLLKGEDQPLVGVLAASSMNNNGRNVSLQSPHGPSQQEIISHCCRAGSLSGFDIDSVEIYGAGGILSDAIEVSSWSRTLRTKDGETDPLLFSCVKTLHGNCAHATGTVSFVRTLYANSWGMVSPSLHLFQLNPHIDAYEEPVNFVTEAIEFRFRSSYVGSAARGWGGTNACAFAWGRVDESRLASAPKLPDRDQLVFWPGGGGSLDTSQQPRKGFHISGTFTHWEPEPMEMERSGVYTYEFTLSENRWEQFQIWLDGDPKKCLHPEEAKAGKLTKVFGPDPTPEGSTWLVEGRTESVPAEEAAAALGDATEAIVDGKQLATREVGGLDRALIGAKYKVRLYSLGKYRMVDWERLTGRPEDESQLAVVAEAAQALIPSSYCVSADWNGWGFEPMRETETPGVFALDVHLIRSGGDFQIVRNRSWEQVFYPFEGGTAAGEPSSVGGPDDQGEGRCWSLHGRRGDTFRIQFSRKIAGGLDVRKVTWEKTGKADLSAEQKASLERVRYAVFGSWDGGARLRELKWTGEYHSCFVELASAGKEEFQLVQDMDWDKLFYPSIAEATPSAEHQILGPAPGDGRSRGHNWTIGKEGYEKAGDIFEVKVFDEARYFGKYLRRVEWAKIASGRDMSEAEAEGLVLRRARR